MAARVGTVLSDEHILKHCAHYRPIPMKLAAKILDGKGVSAKTSPFTSKPLKYVAQLSRPAHFDSYAHSIARNLGNDPEFRSRLHTAYTADIAEHLREVLPEIDPFAQQLFPEAPPVYEPVPEEMEAEQQGAPLPPDLNQMPDVPMGEQMPKPEPKFTYEKTYGIPAEEGTQSRADTQKSQGKQNREGKTKNFREKVEREAAEEAARYAKTKRKAPFTWESQKDRSNQGGKEPDNPEPGPGGAGSSQMHSGAPV